MGGSRRFARPYRSAFYFLTGLYLAFNIIGIDHSCLDAADSAYLVSARAIGEGMVPYRDFLAAHPPGLYLAGAPLSWLGGGVLPFRLFILVISAALAITVWKLARRFSGRDDIAFLAGSFTLFAPLGIFFSKLFIQDSLVALLGVSAMLALLAGSRRRLVAAAVLSLLALFTKLTFLPWLLVLILYVYLYRRRDLSLFLGITLGGSLTLVLLLEILAGGSFLRDIVLDQSSKDMSFTNFYEGLHRIWGMDWALLLPAVPGAWLAYRHLSMKGMGGARFLLAGWFAAGLAVLFTLFAVGHDTNLYLLMEPAIALLAAWGIMGLAEMGKPLPVVAAIILLLVSVVMIVDKDRILIRRSNAEDVAMIKKTLLEETEDGQASLVPGCYALEAGRPLSREFFDQFLWEEKLARGDDDALQMFAGLEAEITTRSLPVIVFEDDRTSLEVLGPSIDLFYRERYDSEQWPPVTMWQPRGIEAGPLRR